MCGVEWHGAGEVVVVVGKAWGGHPVRSSECKAIDTYAGSIAQWLCIPEMVIWAVGQCRPGRIQFTNGHTESCKLQPATTEGVAAVGKLAVEEASGSKWVWGD